MMTNQEPQPKIVENLISFDFDGTLDDDFDGTNNPIKEEIQSVCRDLIHQGKDVCIITKRYGPDSGMGETDKVYKLAMDLGVKNIYFTDRELKDSKIKELGIEMHFENSEYEARVIQFRNPKCVVVLVTDPCWKDLVF
jgi:hypothetical protein